MQMNAILDRITARRTALNLSEAAVSQHGGSRDLIRNWRRAVERGQAISARHDSLVSIARALGVTDDWLINGTEGRPPQSPAPRSTGMAEGATPFQMQPFPTAPDDPQASLRALFGPRAATPATYQLGTALPVFALLAGDIVAVDLARLPHPGELAIVTLADDDTASARTLICRYLPPWLALGSTEDAAPLRVDQPGVTVRCPVIGSLRGITPTVGHGKG